MALNSCLSSETCTSMSSQFAGSASPAEGDDVFDIQGLSALLVRSSSPFLPGGEGGIGPVASLPDGVRRELKLLIPSSCWQNASRSRLTRSACVAVRPAAGPDSKFPQPP